jgi:LacI family transcriptional regulator/LacI family repressor for deo operon, udp, cdd, tsx, nupC, and nupG
MKEKLYIDLMKTESVGGLLLAPVSDQDQKVLDLIKDGIPIVCIDRGISADVDIVVVNNREGAFNAVEHLIKRGHKRIAYISGLPNIATSKFRKQGYLEALKKYNIPFHKELIMYGDSKHVSGKMLSSKLLDLKNPPTALFTGNNLITLGALETIHSRGLKIPDDIAIIGFDDMPWSISLNPPLTAVRQPGYEIGKRSAELLFQRIDDPNRESVKLELKTKLMIRKSC